jgi:hypothetical protein
MTAAATTAPLTCLTMAVTYLTRTSKIHRPSRLVLLWVLGRSITPEYIPSIIFFVLVSLRRRSLNQIESRLMRHHVIPFDHTPLIHKIRSRALRPFLTTTSRRMSLSCARALHTLPHSSAHLLPQACLLLRHHTPPRLRLCRPTYLPKRTPQFVRNAASTSPARTEPEILVDIHDKNTRAQTEVCMIVQDVRKSSSDKMLD